MKPEVRSREIYVAFCHHMEPEVQCGPTADNASERASVRAVATKSCVRTERTTSTIRFVPQERVIYIGGAVYVLLWNEERSNTADAVVGHWTTTVPPPCVHIRGALRGLAQTLPVVCGRRPTLRAVESRSLLLLCPLFLLHHHHHHF